MAIIKDKRLFDLIRTHYNDFFENELNLRTHEISYLAALLMMEELETNLFEANLQRYVDFGHTFSPFLETSLDYEIPHGEAVGMDILLSTSIALNKKLIKREDFDSIFQLIKSIGFSKKHALPDPKKLHASLSEIRMHRAGNLNLVLPVKIGAAIFTNECSLLEIERSIQFLHSTNLFNSQRL